LKGILKFFSPYCNTNSYYLNECKMCCFISVFLLMNRSHLYCLSRRGMGSSSSWWQVSHHFFLFLSQTHQCHNKHRYAETDNDDWQSHCSSFRMLFELLVLSGAQVGSDWTSTLKKRQDFRLNSVKRHSYLLFYELCWGWRKLIFLNYVQSCIFRIWRRNCGQLNW